MEEREGVETNNTGTLNIAGEGVKAIIHKLPRV